MQRLRHTDIADVELPIIQAPMAGLQDSALAIAVNSAGGLGSLPCAMLSPSQLESELQTLKQAKGAIHVNFFCHAVPDSNADLQARWREALTPFFDELDLPLPEAVTTPSRRPFDHTTADIIEPFRPDVISFHFGVPEDDLLARVSGWGCTLLSSATTVEEARYLEAKGVDGIIAQGLEAGGHRGMFLRQDLAHQLGTFALVPQLVRQVKKPIIAAGGIADAAGVEAAMALGAAAAQVGTSYLLCEEAKTSPLHRAALQAEGQNVALTTLFSGRPAQGIVNRIMRELGPMPDGVPAFPLASNEITALRVAAEALGRDDFTPLWCGQNATGARAIAAADMTKALAARCLA